MYTLHTITIEHIQGFLLAHLIQINQLYRLQFETDYMQSRDFPWHTNLGLGMEFDVFILQGNEQRIFLNFGGQIT